MKKLTQEQRMAFVMAMQMKSKECSKLAMKLAEGKDTLPAHAKTGEADGCDLVAFIVRASSNIDEKYLVWLEQHAYGYDCEASEARTEASRVFFEHKAAAIRSAKLCLADLLGVTKETPKAPTFEEMKKKAMKKLTETYKLVIRCDNKGDKNGRTHWMTLGNQLIEAYVDLGLITPEEGNSAFAKACEDLWYTTL